MFLQSLMNFLNNKEKINNTVQCAVHTQGFQKNIHCQYDLHIISQGAKRF